MGELQVDLREEDNGKVLLEHLTNGQGLGLYLETASETAEAVASREEVEQLAAALDVMLAEWPEPEPATSTTIIDAIRGGSVVITGTVPGFARDILGRVLANELGSGTRVKVTGDVVSATTHLLVGEKPGENKRRRARQLGIPELGAIELVCDELGWIDSSGRVTGRGQAAKDRVAMKSVTPPTPLTPFASTTMSPLR